jgi:gluconolactonase
MRRPATLVLLLATASIGGVAAQTLSSHQAVVRLDPALDELVSADARIEGLKTDYFGAVEGPVWVPEGGGYLLFSDMAANVIYRWTPAGELSVFLERSGFTGTNLDEVGGQYFNGRLHTLNIGSNGLALDRQGRLVIAAMTDRALTRLEKDGTRTVLADRFEGKRLSSPNDLAVKSNGAIYFTETTSGLRGRDESPSREIPFHGLYLWKDGALTLLDKDPQGAAPNGIALSPDERWLYVGGGRFITRYEIQPDDTVRNARVLVDMRGEKAGGNTDGMRADRRGNLYISAPGGVWVVSPEGKHLGTIVPPERVANIAFGDADGKSLYMVGGRSLWRLRVNTPGLLP